MNNKDLNVNYINPFLEAAIHVFKQLFNFELKKDKISLKGSPSPELDVAIIIGITGHFVGVVVYCMKNYTAKKITSTLLEEELQTMVTEENINDALGEIANMITGNATGLIKNKTKDLEITTPTVVTGDAFNLTLLKQTTVIIDMISPFGKIQINIALKKY